MDNEYAHDNDPERESTQPEMEPDEDATSLRGKGWDILVGGEEHALALGGSDPFDLLSDDLAAGETPEPFTTGSAEPPAPLFEEPLPADVFGDRGRGAEFPEPPSMSAGLEAATAAAPGQPAFPAEGPIVLSPGVSAEVLGSATGAAETAEVPHLPLDEYTTPPGDLSTLEAATPAAEPFASAGPLPFTGSASAPFGASSAAASGAALPFPAPFSETAAAGAAPSPSTGVTPVGERFVSSQAFLPHDPFEQSPPVTAPDLSEELKPEPSLESQLITQERIDALWDEINETYDLVVNDVRGYYRATETALADLKRARELLLAGKEQFDNAEEIVMRVKARLRLEEKVRQWSSTRGTWLAIYLVIWLLLISGIFLFTNEIGEFIIGLMPSWIGAAVIPGVFGSLGGVIGALWVLIKHIARKRDFDPIHTPWYVVNPFMGFALGVVAYLMVSATSGVLGGNTILTADTMNPPGLLTMYALCVIVGFNQNVLWALVDRVVEAIVPTQETVPTIEEETTGET